MKCSSSTGPCRYECRDCGGLPEAWAQIRQHNAFQLIQENEQLAARISELKAENADLKDLAAVATQESHNLSCLLREARECVFHYGYGYGQENYKELCARIDEALK